MTTRDLVAQLLERPVTAPVAAAVALHGIDTLAALEAGLKTGEGDRIAAFYEGDDGALRAAGMAAVIRYTECDDIEVPSCLTPACIAVPVAIEFAQDPAKYAQAVEAGCAIGLAIARGIGGVRSLGHGVWPTLLAAPAIAAMTASAAMELDEEQTLNALSLALAGASGRGGRPAGYPSGRWLAVGEATLKGVRAAQAAAADFGADPELLSGEWLAAQSSSELADPSQLEAVHESAICCIGLKPFVSARQGANAIQAMRELLAEGLDASFIYSIEVKLPAAAVGVVSRPLDVGNRLSTIANMGLQLGIACHEPGRLLDVERARPFGGETLSVAGKVVVSADPSLDQGRPSFPAIVRVDAGGTVTEARCDVLAGDAGGANQREMLRTKLEGLGTGRAITSLLEAGDVSDFHSKATGIVSALWLRGGDDFSARSTVRMA